jgi:peptide/nickel transport system permease protein
LEPSDNLARRLTRARSRHPLLFFVVRRLFALVLLGLGMTVIGFTLTHLVPGDSVSANLGERAAADPEIVRAYRERYGLDQPILVQYGIYLTHLLHGE